MKKYLVMTLILFGFIQLQAMSIVLHTDLIRQSEELASAIVGIESSYTVQCEMPANLSDKDIKLSEDVIDGQQTTKFFISIQCYSESYEKGLNLKIDGQIGHKTFGYSTLVIINNVAIDYFLLPPEPQLEIITPKTK